MYFRRFFEVVLTVFIRIPILLAIGFFVYVVFSNALIEWRFNSHELNRSIVQILTDSFEMRDVSELFLPSITAEALRANLEEVGYACHSKILLGENDGTYLACQGNDRIVNLCTKAIILRAEFDALNVVEYIRAKHILECL